ncbi:MAG: hypothetical protein KU37_11490 [Sulfuricurvum sp. PC08-66]|nr:MAG: hypothetical protein KU37_11490 [Sulfuricurvum sp. PC08-66]
MKNIQTENTLLSLLDILRHIRHVQTDVMGLCDRSGMAFHGYFESSATPPPPSVIEAFQYYDIVSQQLQGVQEVIGNIDRLISVYLHAVKHDQHALTESIEKLSGKLIKSLESARSKRDAFSGNALNPTHGEDISFF